MKFTRDDWMVIERGLQDRIATLEGSPNYGIGQLRSHEVEECDRLRAIINAHIEQTHVKPAAA